jgi:hypothetical protein
MAEENGDATWLKSTFKMMISQLRRCWKLAEVAGVRGLMRRPTEVAGVGGRSGGSSTSPPLLEGLPPLLEAPPPLLKAAAGRRGSETRSGASPAPARAPA